MIRLTPVLFIQLFCMVTILTRYFGHVITKSVTKKNNRNTRKSKKYILTMFGNIYVLLFVMSCMHILVCLSLFIIIDSLHKTIYKNDKKNNHVVYYMQLCIFIHALSCITTSFFITMFPVDFEELTTFKTASTSFWLTIYCVLSVIACVFLFVIPKPRIFVY